MESHSPFPPLALLVTVKDKGGENSKKFVLRKRSITIGRSSKNDICIRDLSCSKHHACMIYDPEEPLGLKIVDLSSKHGTYINSREVLAAKRRDGNVEEWINKAERNSSSQTNFIQRLERKIKRLKDSKNTVIERSEDSTLRVNDTLRVGQVECSLIYCRDDDVDNVDTEHRDNVVVIVINECDERTCGALDVNIVDGSDDDNDDDNDNDNDGHVVRKVKQSESFKHWAKGAHDKKHRIAITDTRTVPLDDHPTVESAESVYQGLRREQIEGTIEQGDFINSLREKNTTIKPSNDSSGRSSSSMVGRETIGLDLLKKLGWDEVSSLGVTGERANEPIHVTKRPGRAGLGFFRPSNDASRVLNGKATSVSEAPRCGSKEVDAELLQRRKRKKHILEHIWV